LVAEEPIERLLPILFPLEQLKARMRRASHIIRNIARTGRKA
jgi:hypothetical protein